METKEVSCELPRSDGCDVSSDNLQPPENGLRSGQDGALTIPSDDQEPAARSFDSLLVDSAKSALTTSLGNPPSESDLQHRLQLTRRFGAGSLFATVLQRYALLFTQRDREKLKKVISRVAAEFRELCPPGVSEIEIVAAERVVVARMKVQVFELLSLTPEAWSDLSHHLEKRQERASRELERAMKAFLATRKAASSVPGFRMTVSEETETDAAGGSRQVRSVTVESVAEVSDEERGGESNN